MRISYQNLSELQSVAEQIIAFAQHYKIWIFEGEMGVGKTTLIKSIGQLMQVEDTIQSPTYSIVNEYHTRSGNIIYHFDFYRIREESEAMDLGYEEYFYDDKYCFIEWASRIQNLIPPKHLEIAIFLQSNRRVIELKRYE